MEMALPLRRGRGAGYAGGVRPRTRAADRDRDADRADRFVSVVRGRFQSGGGASPVSFRRDAGHAIDPRALRGGTGARRITDGPHGHDRSAGPLQRDMALDVPAAHLRALLPGAATGRRSRRAAATRPALIVSRSHWGSDSRLSSAKRDGAAS